MAGELEYLIDGTWTQAPAGSTIFVPPGHVHAWRNTTDRPARQLAITARIGPLVDEPSAAARWRADLTRPSLARVRADARRLAREINHGIKVIEGNGA